MSERKILYTINAWLEAINREMKTQSDKINKSWETFPFKRRG